MASMTSTLSGNNIVYTITDVQSNTVTVTAPPAPLGPTFVSSATGLLQDGQALLANLLLQLQTGLRPKVLPNGTSSTSN